MDCSPPSSLSMGFPRQEYWSGLPFPSPGDLLNPGNESMSPELQAVSCIAGRFFIAEPPGEPNLDSNCLLLCVSFCLLIIHTRLFIARGKKFRNSVCENISPPKPRFYSKMLLCKK